MLQLMAFYFVPSLVFKVRIERFTAAILAMSLNYAAYFAEIYRSGLESMPIGQYEAAAVLGFVQTKIFQIHPSTGSEENHPSNGK